MKDDAEEERRDGWMMVDGDGIELVRLITCRTSTFVGSLIDGDE